MNAAGDGTPGKYLEVFMEAYSDFARVYDIFMDNVEYEKWAEYLIGSLKELKTGSCWNLAVGPE